MNVGVIVLNYLAYEATINCIKSFKKQKYKDINLEFVIIDNASPNESLQILNESFHDDSQVHIYGLEKNMGFAKGNNYGYKKLKELMQPDYVIISNDDVILEQPGIFKWITLCYEKYKFAVLGPSIYSVNGNCYQSPMNNLGHNKLKCIYFLVRNILLRKYLEFTKIFLAYKEKKRTVTDNENLYYDTFHDDMTLHGSFQIFSPEYFRYYDEPYYPETFLYMEEDFLRLRCEQKGLRMCYDPMYTVQHLSSVSTIMEEKLAVKRKISRINHLENSMRLYLRELERESL